MTHAHINPLLSEGSIVTVPDPIPNEDLHNHGFCGMLIGYRNGYAQVRDCDDNVFEIEPERLALVADNLLYLMNMFQLLNNL